MMRNPSLVILFCHVITSQSLASIPSGPRGNDLLSTKEAVSKEPDLALRSSDFDPLRRSLTEFIWEQRGETILPDSLPDDQRIGETFDVSGDGSRLVFSTRGPAQQPGWTRVVQFDAATQTWHRLGQDLVGPRVEDTFGQSVALSADGTTLAVGATQSGYPNVPRPLGFVRLYRYNSATATWNPIGQDIVGEASGDQSGSAVKLSADGQTVAIRAALNAGTSLLLNSPGGHVRVYSLNGASSTWIQMGEDIDGDARFEGLPNSIAMSSNGRVLAVGGQNTPRGMRIVRVLEYNNTSNSWEQRGDDLEAPGFVLFETSVALSADGRIVAASDSNESFMGRVRVYRYIDGSSAASPRWVQLGNNVVGDGGDFFAQSVDLSADGTLLAVTARGGLGNSPPPRVQLFRLTNDLWQPASQSIVPVDRFPQTIRLSMGDGTLVALGDSVFGETGAIRVFGETDQTPRPTVSTLPTMGPTMRPTVFQPPTAPSPFFCFAGDSVVQVEGSPAAATKMRDLNIGDRIRAGNGRFEPIYSFGHKLSEVYHSDFLRITVVGDGVAGAKRLTLTADHLVFVAGGVEGRVIPASLVQVGAQIPIVEEEDGSATLGTVVKIEERVAAHGLYAPLTPSGTLIVNGMRVSAFTSVQGSEILHIRGFATGLSHHWLAQTLKVPHRIWCHHLNLCEEETYIDGMSTWMHLPYNLYVWWSRQSVLVQTVAAIPFGLWLLLCACLDALFFCSTYFSLTVGVFLFFVCRQKRLQVGFSI